MAIVRDQVTYLRVSRISPECNDRTQFDPKDLEVLADSIKELGLLQPVIVRRRPDGQGYYLIAGERRWRAHQLIGAKQIKAIVKDADDDRTSTIMLAENVVRSDLNPMDEAAAYQRRIDAGRTAAEISKSVGVSVNRIWTYLPLMQLAPEIADMVRKGHLSVGQGWELHQLDHAHQRAAVQALGRHDMTVTELRSVCRDLLADQQTQSMFDADNFLQVEEYVIQAKAKRASRNDLLALIRDLVDAGGDNLPAELIARAEAVTA